LVTLAAHYLAGADPTSVLASPIYADLKGDFQRFAGRGVIEAQESIDLIGAFTKKRVG